MSQGAYGNGDIATLQGCICPQTIAGSELDIYSESEPNDIFPQVKHVRLFVCLKLKLD